MDFTPDATEKEQPWKRLFQASGKDSAIPVEKSLEDKRASVASDTPWKDWTPDPARPDEKPWIEWMNDSRFTGKALMKQAGADLKETERGREKARTTTRKGRPPTLSPRGTVAEGG
ncbi:hypothetical protein NW752_001776 [Fusarium irregulare]|uniref:Uncharacterized protein n=1 Tax=Fusarium irregulare TaxID=2494466 RepID=A0A9W8UD00_9HYPO|nr:hypothetical protein NW766_003942 [Fusarium irregulare]KAJ4026820.1 hypothetical protein NW752_001776 [Fusarium irregulare]